MVSLGRETSLFRECERRLKGEDEMQARMRVLFSWISRIGEVGHLILGGIKGGIDA